MSGSSVEVEYRSMANVTCELTWLLSLLKEVEIKHASLAIFYCDNQAAFHIAANQFFMNILNTLKLIVKCQNRVTIINSQNRLLDVF